MSRRRLGFWDWETIRTKDLKSTRSLGLNIYSLKGGGDAAASGKSVACIEAVGGGKSTGRLVGSSLGASVAPSVTGIPIVGWLAAGWITMFGGDQGSNVGGIMTESLTEECNEV